MTEQKEPVSGSHLIFKRTSVAHGVVRQYKIKGVDDGIATMKRGGSTNEKDSDQSTAKRRRKTKIDRRSKRKRNENPKCDEGKPPKITKERF